MICILAISVAHLVSHSYQASYGDTFHSGFRHHLLPGGVYYGIKAADAKVVQPAISDMKNGCHQAVDGPYEGIQI